MRKSKRSKQQGNTDATKKAFSFFAGVLVTAVLAQTPAASAVLNDHREPALPVHPVVPGYPVPGDRTTTEPVKSRFVELVCSFENLPPS